MPEHPTLEQLEDWLFGELPAGEASAVLAHLATDCEACHRHLAPLVSAFAAPAPERAERSPEYDQAINRAFSVARERFRSLGRSRAQIEKKLPAIRAARTFRDLDESGIHRLDGWALCEALLACSREERYRDPRKMLLFAKWAQFRSLALSPERYGRLAVADLQALAWAETANAFRVTDDLHEADKAMAAAFRALEKGSGDPLLLARMLDLSASLDGARRRLRQAVEKLERAHSIFDQHGERHRAGRALLQMGRYLMYQQKMAAATEAMSAGLALIDPEQDPKLTLAAYHNLIRLLMERGEYRRARREIFRQRRLYLEHGDPLTLTKLRWLEAQIAAGLGELDRAEIGFESVRAEFAAGNLHYKAALASLELGAVWLRQGRTALIPPLVDEILVVFHANGIAREAIASAVILRQAYERGALSLALFQEVTEILKALEQDPATGAER